MKLPVPLSANLGGSTEGLLHYTPLLWYCRPARLGCPLYLYETPNCPIMWHRSGLNENIFEKLYQSLNRGLEEQTTLTYVNDSLLVTMLPTVPKLPCFLLIFHRLVVAKHYHNYTLWKEHHSVNFEMITITFLAFFFQVVEFKDQIDLLNATVLYLTLTIPHCGISFPLYSMVNP